VKPAVKNYTRNLLLAIASYGFMLFGINSYLANNDVPQWAQAILALLPMLPVLVVLKTVVVFSRSWDELQRKQATEAMLISFFVTGFGTFAYGFLEGVGFPPLETIWVMPIMMGCYGAAQMFVVRRY